MSEKTSVMLISSKSEVPKYLNIFADILKEYKDMPNAIESIAPQLILDIIPLYEDNFTTTWMAIMDQWAKEDWIGIESYDKTVWLKEHGYEKDYEEYKRELEAQRAIKKKNETRNMRICKNTPTDIRGFKCWITSTANCIYKNRNNPKVIKEIAEHIQNKVLSRTNRLFFKNEEILN